MLNCCGFCIGIVWFMLGVPGNEFARAGLRAAWCGEFGNGGFIGRAWP